MLRLDICRTWHPPTTSKSHRGPFGGLSQLSCQPPTSCRGMTAACLQGTALNCPGLLPAPSPCHAFLVVTPQHLDLAALALLTTDQAMLEALTAAQPYEALCAGSEALLVRQQADQEGWGRCCARVRALVLTAALVHMGWALIRDVIQYHGVDVVPVPCGGASYCPVIAQASQLTSILYSAAQGKGVQQTLRTISAALVKPGDERSRFSIRHCAALFCQVTTMAQHCGSMRPVSHCGICSGSCMLT